MSKKNKKSSSRFTETQKLKAIEKLLELGHRGDEWQEAGLLEAVAQVVNETVEDLSSETIEQLIDKASNN